ncbi:MAG: outer membrane beta-barrel protein [Hyphomicrobiales bacterium]|nr:outer membrane beta-barrel protein [Hyphomicrobiales bacterium]
MAALIGPVHAGQAGTWYLRGDIGVGISDFAIWDDEIAIAGGGGFGYYYNQMFRSDITFDGAFDYEQRVLGVDVSLDTYSVMANGYWDIPAGGGFTPYLGAGVGYGWADASAAGFTASTDGVAVAGMAGASFNMTQSIALDLGYKYRRIILNGQDIGDHMVRAGVRFDLN